MAFIKSKSRLASLVCLALLSSQASVFAQSAPVRPGGSATVPTNLDLSSGTRTPYGGSATTTINSGGSSMTVTPNTPISGAESLAVMQIQSTGRQSIVIDNHGGAAGGFFALTPELNSLNLPAGVTAVDNLASASRNFGGNLNVAGTLFVYTSNAQVAAANITAANIFVQRGGLITSAASLVNPNITNQLTIARSNLGLNLSALGSIVNAGAITSSGQLNMSAGDSIVNGTQAALSSAHGALFAGSSSMPGAGSMTAQLGNFSAQAPSIVNSGIMQSLAGNASVTALQNVVNTGVINASQNLNLLASGALTNQAGATLQGNNVYLFSGVGNFVNAGSIIANGGNIGVSSGAASHIDFNNTNGTMKATEGAIAFGPPVYSSSFHPNVNLVGGDLEANKVIFNIAGGNLFTDVNSLLGDVEITAANSEMHVQNGGLKVTVMNLTEDPVFTAASGPLDLTFSSATLNTSGQQFVALASGNVRISGSSPFQTATISTGGGLIRIGAGVTFDAGNNITGASGSGGDIQLATISLNSAGGAIALTANKNTAGTAGGNISMADVSSAGNGTLVAGANGGNGGTINVTAGGNVQINSLDSSGGRGGDAGAATSAGAQGTGATGTTNAVTSVTSVTTTTGSGSTAVTTTTYTYHFSDGTTATSTQAPTGANGLGLPAGLSASAGSGGAGGSGGSAYSDGGNGATGGTGGNGSNGGNGGSAGAITISAGSFVNLGQVAGNGGVGGSGGAGGNGGNGGNGGSGGDSYAAGNAGDGGNGGVGGRGGNGGLGGAGGSAAAVLITSTNEYINFRGIQLNGGTGGVGGNGGDGGGGGAGGSGGTAYGLGASGDGGSGAVGGAAGSGAAAGNGGAGGSLTVSARTSVAMPAGAGISGIYELGGAAGAGGSGGTGGSGGGGAGGSAGLVGGGGGAAGSGGAGGAGSGGGAGGSGGSATITARDVSLTTVSLNGGNGGTGGSGGSGYAAGAAGGGAGGLGGGSGGAGGAGGAASAGAGGGRGGNGGAFRVTADSFITFTGNFSSSGGLGGNGGNGGNGGAGSSGADGGGGIIAGGGGGGGGGSSATGGGAGGIGGNAGSLYLSSLNSNISTKSLATTGGAGGNGGNGGNGGSGGNGGTSGVGLMGEDGYNADNTSITGHYGFNIGTTGANGGAGGSGAGGGLPGVGGNGGDIIVLAPLGSISVDGSIKTYGNNSGVIGSKGFDGVNGQNGSSHNYFGMGVYFGVRQGGLGGLFGPQAGLGGSITIENFTVGGLAWYGNGFKGPGFQGATIFANMKNDDGSPVFDFKINLAVTSIDGTFSYGGLTTSAGLSIGNAAENLFSNIAPSSLVESIKESRPNFGSRSFLSYDRVYDPLPPPNYDLHPSTYGGNVFTTTAPGVNSNASTGGNIELTAGTSLTVNGDVNALGGRTVVYNYVQAGNTYNIMQTFFMGAGGSVVAKAPTITVTGSDFAGPQIGGGSIALMTKSEGVDYLIKPVTFAQLRWPSSNPLGLNIANGAGTVLATSPIRFIQNSTGSIDLGTGGLNLFGAGGTYTAPGDLIVIASGNITATGAGGTIDAGTSTARPNGQIILAAGQAAANGSFVTVNGAATTGWLVLGPASSTGGAIALPNVSIGSSKTALVVAQAIGVTGQAQGFVQTGAITTSTGSAFAAPGAVYLSASSNITSGLVTTNSAHFQSYNGAIGSSVSPILVNAPYLQVTSTGFAFLSNSAAEVKLMQSQAGVLSIAATNGNLVVTGPISGSAIILQSTQSVLLRNTVAPTAGVDGIVSIVSVNPISDANGLSNITSPNIILTSSGAISLTNALTTVASSSTTKSSITLTSGTSVTTVGSLNTDILGIQAGNGGITVATTTAGDIEANSLGDVVITATGAVRLGGGTALYSVGDNFTLTAGGTITVTGAVQAFSNLTLTALNNGSIIQYGNIFANTSATLTANGTGSITAPNSAAISTPTLNLVSGSGDIGGMTTPLFTNAGAVTFTTTGNVNLVVSSDVADLHLGSWSGTSLTLVKFGNLYVDGPLTATGQIGTAAIGGQLEVNGLVNAGGNLTLFSADLVGAALATNKVVLNNNVTSTGGTVSVASGTAATVTLAAGKAITGANVIVVTPTLNNNGSIVANGTGSAGNATFISNGTTVGNSSALVVNNASGSTVTASGTMQFNTAANPGTITINGGTLSGTSLNFHGTEINADVAQIIGNMNVTATKLTMTSAAGDLHFASNVDTSSATAAGDIVIRANAGDIVGQQFISRGTGASNSGGIVNLHAQNVRLSGIGANGSTIDVTGTANGGTVTIETTSANPLRIGSTTGNNFIAGSILANGVNGGRISIFNTGAANIAVGGLVQANGTTGTGGFVLFTGLPAGGSNYSITNDGKLEATNTASDSGLVGIHSGPGMDVTILGTGELSAGNAVRVGNLDTTTLALLSVAAGNGTITQSSILNNFEYNAHISSLSLISPGNLTLPRNLNLTNASGSGANLIATAGGTLTFGLITSNGTGLGFNGGTLQLTGKNVVGNQISANGVAGATGGNIIINSTNNVVITTLVATGVADGNGNGGNAGAVNVKSVSSTIGTIDVTSGGATGGIVILNNTGANTVNKITANGVKAGSVSVFGSPIAVGTVSASASSGNGGSVTFNSSGSVSVDTVMVMGTGGAGGVVQLTGGNINITKILASGTAGKGGTVTFAGGNTTAGDVIALGSGGNGGSVTANGANATIGLIEVSSLTGAGGSAVVNSSGSTNVNNVLAMGPTGGGAVTLKGAQITVSQAVNASANNGTGGAIVLTGGSINAKNVLATSGNGNGGSVQGNGGNLTFDLINVSSGNGAGGSVVLNSSGTTTANTVLATGSAGGGTVTINGSAGINSSMINVSDPPFGNGGSVYLTSNGTISVGSIFGTAESGDGGFLSVNAPVFIVSGVIDFSSVSGRGGTVIINGQRVTLANPIRVSGPRGNGTISGTGVPSIDGLQALQSLAFASSTVGSAGRVPTDTTPVFSMSKDTEIETLQGAVEENEDAGTRSDNEKGSAATGVVMTESTFDTVTLEHLKTLGVTVGQGSGENVLNLDRGRVLFAPKKDIVVQTHEGKVVIAANSHVWIVETGHDVSITDLGDSHNGSVSVIASNQQRVDLLPGQQVVLTRNVAQSFDNVNLTPEIGYRGLTTKSFGEGITAHFCEVSILGALSNVQVLRKLRSSPVRAEREICAAMLKNAAILSLVSSRQVPYQKRQQSVSEH